METHNKGIHHITMISGDAQRNAEFYVKSLGMRLVKKSVNQDDPIRDSEAVMPDFLTIPSTSSSSHKPSRFLKRNITRQHLRAT